MLDPEALEPRAGSLLIEAGRIEATIPPGDPLPEGVERRDLAGLSLAPGFLDVHYHGRLVFDAASEASASLRHAASRRVRHGVTGFLATTVAWPQLELVTRVEAWAAAADGLPESGADLLGLHLEGPWIRPEAAGAQPAAGIRGFDASEAADVLAAGSGAVRMVTLAPEVPGSQALVELLVERGLVAALGHSLASAEQMDSATERGARHVTHLFNAMGGLHHRSRGVAGVALTDDRLSCDLICDGVHVHPSVVGLAAAAKREGLLLITDHLELPEAGEAPGFGAGAVHDDGSALRLADGTLAGSSLEMDRALRNAVAFGAMTRLEAVAASTLRPARLLGIEAQRGTLRVGARADLVVLDPGGEVRETWVQGRLAHASQA